MSRMFEYFPPKHRSRGVMARAFLVTMRAGKQREGPPPSVEEVGEEFHARW